MKKWDVLGIGCTTVDDLLYVDQFPEPDFKTRIQYSERQGGGLSGVALVAAARSGATCAYGGQLGYGEYSKFLTDVFQKEGVSLDPVHWHQDASPFHSTVIVDTVHNTRNIFFEKLGEVGPAPDGPSQEAISAARVLHVDHYGGLATQRACQWARDQGVPIVGDIERDNVPHFDAFFPLIDHLIVSQRFALRHSGQGDPAAAMDALWTPKRQVVIVTLAEKGCLMRSGKLRLHFEAYPTEVVDTTGCGDVFHGVYAAALAQQKTLEQRIKWALAAAALKARHRGAMRGCPDRLAIEALVAQPLKIGTL